MRVAVCFNAVPPQLSKGEAADRISEEGAGKEAHAVAAALGRSGHGAVVVPLEKGIPSFLERLHALKPELVFNLCEGYWGKSEKEHHVAALLDLAGFTHTGAPSITLGLTQDKLRTKQLLASENITTPRYLAVAAGQMPKSTELSFPLIVKPANEDASLGISGDSVVSDFRRLRDRIAYIHERYRQTALVEEYIDGREINAAVFGNDPAEVLPFSEICFTANNRYKVVTYEGKWVEESSDFAGTVPVCPAPLKLSERKRLKETALAAYKVCGCRDYARVDIRLRDGIPYVLEVNANPDISPDAGFARSAGAAGIEYDVLIARIASMAARRGN